MPGEQIIALGNERWGESSHARGSSHRLDAEMVVAHVVQYDHVEGRGGRPFLHKPAHMEARCVGSSMHNLVDGSRVPMKCEYHRRIHRKMFDEGSIIHAMWVQDGRIELHQIHHIDVPHLQFRQVMP